ncbi:MAG: flagellar protein [Selenomonadaceae bacterium]|nr:flagellar protein [Selenomonadaceae bacterium]MBR3722635.1 flagellar protein [Selenomonadaceae bacterium]
MAVNGKPKNCPKCGRIYMEVGRKMCLECYEKTLKLKLTVFEYVREHQGCNLDDIMEATGATMPLIREMIREGYFDNEKAQISYPCIKCGAPIFYGKMCVKCFKKLQKEIKVSKDAIEAREKLAQYVKATAGYKTMGRQKRK